MLWAVAMGGCYGWLPWAVVSVSSFVQIKSLILSLSLSFFFKRGDDVILGFGTVAAVMLVTTASPPPDFWSLSVFPSVSFCLSLILISFQSFLSLSFLPSLSFEGRA